MGVLVRDDGRALMAASATAGRHGRVVLVGVPVAWMERCKDTTSDTTMRFNRSRPIRLIDRAQTAAASAALAHEPNRSKRVPHNAVRRPNAIDWPPLPQHNTTTNKDSLIDVEAVTPRRYRTRLRSRALYTKNRPTHNVESIEPISSLLVYFGPFGHSLVSLLELIYSLPTPYSSLKLFLSS